MNSIIERKEDLIAYIKSVILRYCPYVSDRLCIFDLPMAPELDIRITIDKNGSKIIFMFGNSTFKASIQERAAISYMISFEEMCDLIDFILADHDVIKFIDIPDLKLVLKFAINWTEDNINGICCDDIGLELHFEDAEVKKNYLYMLLQRYSKELEKVPSFKKIKPLYIGDMKVLTLNEKKNRTL